ncbi:DUF2474 family protein [Paraburkholderia sp.]|jgi:hypothetical protein|uniref:DUF2474 family protein n=1 Tax=Paraburkholderia sp. TaxID=1926495 RepID=UPI002604BF60|nr:DUF2474 family protein [Paraburkholderia sp.]
MRLFLRPTTQKQTATSLAQPATVNRPAPTRLKRVLWFVALWCAGVAAAMLLALPFRLLMQAAMH